MKSSQESGPCLVVEDDDDRRLRQIRVVEVEERLSAAKNEGMT